MTRWNQQQPSAVREAMLDEVGDLIRQGKLGLKYKTWSLAEYAEALEAAQSGFTDTKQILLFS